MYIKVCGNIPAYWDKKSYILTCGEVKGVWDKIYKNEGYMHYTLYVDEVWKNLICLSLFYILD